MSTGPHRASTRFKILFGSALAASAVLTAAALLWISADGTPLGFHMVAAVTLAVTLSMLLAAGLMGLLFLSNASGHDEDAAAEAARHDPDLWQRDDPGL